MQRERLVIPPQIEIRRVANALGITLGKIPSEDIQALAKKVSEIRTSLTPYETTEEGILTGEILSDELAEKINTVVFELPENIKIYQFSLSQYCYSQTKPFHSF